MDLTALRSVCVWQSMSSLLEQYGRFEIGAGVQLWTRKHVATWEVPDHEVFFHTSPGQRLGGDFEYHSVAIRALTLITPFEELEHVKGRCFTSLHKLCAQLEVEGFDDDLDDVSWKSDRRRRRPLIDKLLENGIDGWYHPVQNYRGYMEACIFKASSSVALVKSIEDPKLAK